MVYVDSCLLERDVYSPLEIVVNQRFIKQTDNVQGECVPQVECSCQCGSGRSVSHCRVDGLDWIEGWTWMDGLSVLWMLIDCLLTEKCRLICRRLGNIVVMYRLVMVV